MKRNRPLRCRLGFHRWTRATFDLCGSPLFECLGCGHGRAVLVRGSVHINYHPEDMDNIRSAQRYYEGEKGA